MCINAIISTYQYRASLVTHTHTHTHTHTQFNSHPVTSITPDSLQTGPSSPSSYSHTLWTNHISLPKTPIFNKNQI